MNKIKLALCLSGLCCLQGFSLDLPRLSDQPLDPRIHQTLEQIQDQQAVATKEVTALQKKVEAIPEAKRNDEEIDLFSIAQNLNDIFKKAQQFVKKYNLKREFFGNSLGFLTFYIANALLNLFPIISSPVFRIPAAFWFGSNTSANLKKDKYWDQFCKTGSDLAEKIKKTVKSYEIK